MADEVRLVDLEVIKRYSLAVRQESAPAEDLLAALEHSRDAVLAAMGPAPKAARRSEKPTKAAKAPKSPASPKSRAAKAKSAG